MRTRLAGLILLLATSTPFYFLSCSPVQNYLSPDGPKFLGKYSKDFPVFNGSIRVVTFNIAFGEKIDQAIYELNEYPELKGADIILLQEMDESGTELISQVLQYNYVYFPATIHRHHRKNLGNAILSKWPIEDEKKTILPHTYIIGKTRKIAVSAKILIKELEVLVYSVHTATILLSKQKRISQADSIIKSIPENTDYVIVGGDFNTVGSWNVEDLETIFRDNGFIRASEDAGATVKIGPFHLTSDHIFVKGMRVLDSGAFEKSKASDHSPVWVILKPD